MASGQWQALAKQFQVICPTWGAPGAESLGVLQGQMSCGHWVSVAGLRGWVQALLDQGITSFHCPCCPDTPWLWQELCKLGLFSDEDRATLEAQILMQEGARGSYRQGEASPTAWAGIPRTGALRAQSTGDNHTPVTNSPRDFPQCPRSQHLVQRLDPGTLRTLCLSCSQQMEGLYCFCWGCLMDWKDPLPQGNSCSNKQCPLQAALYDTLEIQAPGSSVHGCPSLRACPKCHTLVSHTGLGCPLVECPECWEEFCYRCLREHCVEDSDETDDENEGLDYDNYWETSCSIARRQELKGSS